MALSDLTSSQLKHVIQLVEEKDRLRARLDTINRSLEALEKGKEPTEQSSPEEKAPRRRRRRRKLKEAIVEKLKAAGKQGITVAVLAESLKANPGSVSTWFYTSGKKIKEIKKVAPARYAFISS